MRQYFGNRSAGTLKKLLFYTFRHKKTIPNPPGSQNRCLQFWIFWIWSIEYRLQRWSALSESGFSANLRKIKNLQSEYETIFWESLCWDPQNVVVLHVSPQKNDPQPARFPKSPFEILDFFRSGSSSVVRLLADRGNEPQI